MPIPGPGQAISINTIVTEFGGTAPHAISEYYRGGPEVANAPVNAAIPTSGQIALSNFYGASNRIAIPLTINGVTLNYDVYSNRGPTYVPGISDITVTVSPTGGVGGTGNAMLVPNAFSPTDTVTIINNGVITGSGGNGGVGGSATATPFPTFPTANPSPITGTGNPGGAGNNGLFVNRPVIVQNNGTIAGGGGGGGGGAGRSGANASSPAKAAPVRRAVGGGGGGGGASQVGVGVGAAGGTAVTPTPVTNTALAPGFTGSNGGVSSGGAGGPARPVAPLIGGAGGAGGSVGAAGSSGTVGSGTMGRTGIQPSAGTGGAAGNYIVGNPFVTWTATGTRLGGVA